MNVFRRPEQSAATALLRRALYLVGLASCCARAGWGQQAATAAPVAVTVILPPLIAVAPDFTATEAPDQDDDGLLSFHGLAATQNAATLDGASMTQNFLSVPFGRGSDPAPDPDGDSDAAERTTGPANGLSRGRHAGAAYVFSQAAVREFRLVGGDYSAQIGGAGGGVATTMSRSGGAALHGAAGFTLRSQAFAARNPYSVETSYNNGAVASGLVKPHDLKDAFTASVGGPAPGIRELHYFDSFDGQQRDFPAVSSPADPNFYALTATQKALLANRGVTSAQVNTGLNYLTSLTGTAPRSAGQTLNFLRGDWDRHARAKLGLEWNRVRWNSPAGLIDAPVVARGRASLGNAAGSLDTVLLRFDSTLNRGINNQARIAYTRDEQYETPQTPLTQEPAISPGGLAPEVNIGPNGILFGTPASLSQKAYPSERRVEIAETLTLARGRHLLALGGKVGFVNDLVSTLANAAGTFSYDSGVTNGHAGGLVDFLTDSTFNVNTLPNGGCPAITAATHDFCFRSFSQSFGAQTVAFATAEWAGFAEDTWRARPNLTVHAGVRYEYVLLPIPQNPNPALDAIFGLRGASSSFPEDRNDLGPRLAVAWEPLGRGRGTIHLGYGLFFGRVPGATIRAALTDTAQPNGTTKIRIRPTTVTACPQVPANGFGYPCAYLMKPTGVVAQTTSAVVFDRRFRLPVVQQGSLSLERSVGRKTTIEVGYVMNLDRQLATSTDLNIAPATRTAAFQLQGGTGAPGAVDGETFFLPVYTGRVSPGFGPVTDVLSNVNASYYGLVAKVQSTPIESLQLDARFTWSKAIDYGQSESGTPRTNGQFDPFTNGYDKGLSSLNYPWVAGVTGAWRPRGFGGHRGKELTAGWEIAPIVSARAGRPYSLDLSGGNYLPGGHESLNGSGGALYLPTVGRNTLRLPATANVDLRLSREIAAGAKVRVRVAAEAFNLLNRRNLSSVTQRAYLVGTPVSGVTPLVFQNAGAVLAEGLNTQAFGTPTGSSTGLSRERQAQVGVQVQF